LHCISAEDHIHQTDPLGLLRVDEQPQPAAHRVLDRASSCRVRDAARRHALDYSA
jgi:hypothetical protein